MLRLGVIGGQSVIMEACWSRGILQLWSPQTFSAAGGYNGLLQWDVTSCALNLTSTELLTLSATIYQGIM